MDYEVKDIKLAPQGRRNIEWARQRMAVLGLIKERFAKQKPLKGLRVSACLHVTSQTANLIQTLKAGGAEVVLCASNPLSTQDDVAASLVEDDAISVFARRGEDNHTYYKHIESALNFGPQITMDDGADLISAIHKKPEVLLKGIIGSTEETTTGVIRLKSLEREGRLLFPIIAVNDAKTKYLFDNRYGTGQSTLDGILRATNRLIAGSNFVVCGYGWCGKGLAMRARGMGAKVIVTEVDPLRALEASMDGYQVMPIKKAARIGDVFVTLAGNINVIGKPEFRLMKDGAILANSGHFDVEIDIKVLEQMAVKKRRIREFVDEYTMPGGRRINLLTQGRLVNLAAAEGHPSEVMDMSFANQALAVEFLFKDGKGLKKKVYQVPEDIDRQIAKLKLQTMGISIDTLTKQQEKYLKSWELGT